MVTEIVEAEGEAGKAGPAQGVPELALSDGGWVLRRTDDGREDEVVRTAPRGARLLLEEDESGAAEHRHEALASRRLRRRDDPAVVRRDDTDRPGSEVDGVPSQCIWLPRRRPSEAASVKTAAASGLCADAISASTCSRDGGRSSRCGCPARLILAATFARISSSSTAAARSARSGA